MKEKIRLCGEDYDENCSQCKTCHARQICARRRSESIISQLVDNFVTPRCFCGTGKFCPMHQNVGVPKDF